MPDANARLQELASLYGVHLSYWDVTGKQVFASDDSLVRILRALGASVEHPDRVEPALRQRRRQLWERRLEPVVVCWDGRPPDLEYRCPVGDLGRPHQCRLVLENGPSYSWTMKPGELPENGGIDLDGSRYSARRMSLIGPYPLGYHKLTLDAGGGRTAECTLIAAPERAAEPQGGRHGKTWGLFIPLYALASARSWGAGDYADLAELVAWVQKQGGGIVATLPMLAAFLDEPFEPSPYSPASRLFWNEFYLSVDRIPEFQRSEKAKTLVGSRQFQDDLTTLRKAPLVDYRIQMGMKRRVLEECARALAADGGRRAALEKHVEANPQLRDYAMFRAVGDKRRAAWQTWPAALQAGTIAAGDFEPAVATYHQYVQWLADEQLQQLATGARANGPGLYLDLPLGVNSSSYDTWRHRGAFALDTAAGAPPDPFFAKGQNWGFPPLHPERIREDAYAYVRAYLHHHMRLAGILRIDHMMGLHRLDWIPKDAAAKDGVYVGYRPEELYAVFILEAHRHGTVLVGEDLGTVPEDVPPMMARHNIHRMYVMQYQAQPQEEALSPIFPEAVASINTHDMPTFAGFWEGLDIKDREDLGILDAATATAERKRRRELIKAVQTYLQKHGFLKDTRDPIAVLRACLNFLGTGPGRVALANIEDFWLEKNPQNVPGTWHERPNWTRRARYPMEEFMRMPAVLQALREMDATVKAKGVR